MVDLRQTNKYVKFMENIGWVVERVNNVNYFVRPFPIYGSFMKVQRPKEIDVDQIRDIQKKYKVLHTIIEPLTMNHKSLLISHGFKQSTPYLPSKTLHIDLAKTEDALLKEMHQKTRYNIKLAQKKDIKIIESKDIDLFVKFWKDQKFNRRFFGTKDITELYKVFGKDSHLLLAYKDNELVSGVFSVHAHKQAYYMYAASSQKGKELYGPTLLVWEQIRLAKKKGCKIFDFEGIYDERFPLKDWKGFSRFKKGFGGKEVEYPGASSLVRLF